MLAAVALVAALGGQPAVVAPAARLDLEQAIALALEQNLTRALQRTGPERGRLGLASARAIYSLEVTPSVATARAEGGEDLTTVGVSASRFFATGTQVNASADRVSGSPISSRDRWSVEVSQPLLRRFGRLVNTEPLVRANQALEAAERTLIRQEEDLILDVVRTYLDVLRLERQERADRKALERVDLLSRVTAAKERLGRATKIDSLRVSLELGQIASRLESSTEQLDFARRDLAVLVGSDPGARFRLAPVGTLDLRVPPIEEIVDIALENRLDYAQVLEDLVDSRRAVRIAKREVLPDVSAFARYEDLGDPLVLEPDDRTVLFGLRMSSEVFRRQSKIFVSQTELDRLAVERRVDILKQSIARDVQKAWLAYRRAVSQLSILERNLEHAESRLELAARLFRIGRGDNFSVIDAEEAFVRAESELLSGEAEVTVNGYRLLRSLGTLVDVPQHLKPVPRRVPA